MFENSDKEKGTEKEENDTKMNTMDRNPKAKKKVEYEDIFENSDTENHEKDIQKDTMDGNIKDKKVVKSVVKFS